MKHKALLLIMAIALCSPLQAQYEGLIIKMDYFDLATPKEKRHVELFNDVFTNRYVLTVSTTRTTFSDGYTKVEDGITKERQNYRSKTTTDTIIYLSKEVFNEIAGDCYMAASTFISTKMKTSAYEIVDGSHSTVTMTISNGPTTMEFLFKCPICQQDNPCEEQFRDILERIIKQGCLNSEKILGKCQ